MKTRIIFLSLVMLGALSAYSAPLQSELKRDYGVFIDVSDQYEDESSILFNHVGLASESVHIGDVMNNFHVDCVMLPISRKVAKYYTGLPRSDIRSGSLCGATN